MSAAVPSISRRQTAASKPQARASRVTGPRDRLIADLEQQQTVLQMRLEHLQNLWGELRESRRRLQALYDASAFAHVTLDEQGRVAQFNSRAAEMLPCERPGLAGMPFSAFVVPADLRILLKHVNRCKRAHKEEISSEVRLKTGSHFLPVQLTSRRYLQDGRVLFHTAIIDLTQRRKSEQAVHEAREFSDTIINTIREPLAVLDSQLKIVRVNPAFTALFKVPAPLVEGVALESLMNLWWTGNELRAKLEEALIQNHPFSDFEFEVTLRKQGRRCLSFNARRLHGEESAPLLLLVAIKDITEIREAQRNLADSNKQLRELNEDLEKRVEERTRELRESNEQLEGFCYSIAHDLRAPLRAMECYSTTLISEHSSALGEEGKNFATRIAEASRRMDSLIQGLLEFGRFSTSRFTLTRVNADLILTQVIHELGPAIREANGRVERKGKLPVVLAHPLVLSVGFSNLLANALKFVAPGVTPRVAVWAEPRSNLVRIWISDNGIGIEPEYQKKIFEVFQRLHSQKTYPGTGVGLAIVSKAVHRIGGTVGVESEAGKGSRFWLEVPGDSPHPAPARLSEEPIPAHMVHEQPGHSEGAFAHSSPT